MDAVKCCLSGTNIHTHTHSRTPVCVPVFACGRPWPPKEAEQSFPRSPGVEEKWKNASGRDCLFGFYEAVNTNGYFMALADLLVTADGQYWLITAWPSICGAVRGARWGSLGFFVFFCFVWKMFSLYLDVIFFSLIAVTMLVTKQLVNLVYIAKFSLITF